MREPKAPVVLDISNESRAVQKAVFAFWLRLAQIESSKLVAAPRGVSTG